MNIVEFNSDNEVRIDGLYAQAVQLKAESAGEYKTLAFIHNDESEQVASFENGILIGQFKEFSLYLTRSDNSINIIEIDVVLLKALRPNPSPTVEYTIVNNEIMPMAPEFPVETPDIGEGQYITAPQITTVVNKINTEAERRDNLKSYGAITQRGTAPTAGSVINLGDTSFSGTASAGSWANIAAPLNKISPVSVPTSTVDGTTIPDLILATGDGTYQYLYDLAEDYSAISVTATSTGCNASCTGLCRTGCYSGCTGCTGGCSGSCTGGCGNNCRGTCRYTCGGGCSNSCNGGYRGGCSDCTYGVESGECC